LFDRKRKGAIKGRKNSVRFETLINSDMCVTRTLLSVKPHLDEKILIVESEFCAGGDRKKYFNKTRNLSSARRKQA